MPSTNPALKLKKFLDCNVQSTAPILLGLSGGPDSLMLFYLLLELSANFGVAHIDHGWRKESKDEAKELESLALKHQVPFHLKKLDPKKTQGNLEAYCRQERISFFKDVCHAGGYQAVLLGHHADDQAETVLKRLFEGASLSALVGLAPVTYYENLPLWRPLLNLKKEEILSWLAEKKIQAFDDITNRDLRFLRARMRVSMIPSLSQEFGKNISSPLVKIAQEAAELNEFLDFILLPYVEKIEKQDFFLFLDLSCDCPATRFEIKYLVRKLCRMAKIVLSHQQIDTAADLIITNASSKKLLSKNGELSIHLRRLTLKKTF